MGDSLLFAETVCVLDELAGAMPFAKFPNRVRLGANMQ
jgi:hypothetical protein